MFLNDKMVQPITYETLKHIAINDLTTQNNLEDLKYMFRNEIGSARKLYRINTAAALIDCLERHDILSEFNIEPFREIADEYGGTLAEVVSSYYVPKATPLYNEYQEIRLAYECATRMHISGDINSGLSNGTKANRPSFSETNNKKEAIFTQILPAEKRAAIYKLVAEEIGTDWRCFGRELEIRQGAMDNIEIQYRDLNTRVYKLFQVFEDDDSTDPKRHLLIICRALDECRRKDLRRRVERIMSH